MERRKGEALLVFCCCYFRDQGLQLNMEGRKDETCCNFALHYIAQAAKGRRVKGGNVIVRS